MVFRLVNNDNTTNTSVQIVGDTEAPGITAQLNNDTAPVGVDEPGLFVGRHDHGPDDVGDVDGSVVQLLVQQDGGTFQDITSAISGSGTQFVIRPANLTAGPHQFTFEAVDPNGVTSTATVNMVFDLGPTAVIAGQSTTIAGSTLTFDGSPSTTDVAPIYSYNWQLPDGSNSSGPTTSFDFSAGRPGHRRLDGDRYRRRDEQHDGRRHRSKRAARPDDRRVAHGHSRAAVPAELVVQSAADPVDVLDDQLGGWRHRDVLGQSFDRVARLHDGPGRRHDQRDGDQRSRDIRHEFAGRVGYRRPADSRHFRGLNGSRRYALRLGSRRVRSEPDHDLLVDDHLGDGDVQTVSGNPSSVTHTYSGGPNDYTISATATDQNGTYDSNTLPAHGHAGALGPTISGNPTVNEGAVYTLNWHVSNPDQVPSTLDDQLGRRDGRQTVTGNPTA